MINPFEEAKAMVMLYDPKNCRKDLNEFLGLREVEGRLLAIFHVDDPDLDLTLVVHPPLDPEVGLTMEDLKNRISKREANGKEVVEEKKAWREFGLRGRRGLVKVAVLLLAKRSDFE